MMKEIAKVPVLFIAFNRPDTAVKSFSAIRAYQPHILYIAIDGPRTDHPDDRILCQQTQTKIMNLIDWECKVKTLFREINAGCGRGVSEAVSWMFQSEEMGVIIEDDCQASVDFFKFCEEILPRYRQDERIAQVNGFDLSYSSATTNTYFFTSYPSCWGWATWKRAWENLNFTMQNWKSDRKKIFKRFPFAEACIHYLLWSRLYRNIQKQKKLNIWDFQWSIYVFLQNKLCINPFANLVVNTGFGINSTNCSDPHSPLSQAAWGKLDFPLQHPAEVALHTQEEQKKSQEYVKHYCGLLISKFKIHKG